MEGTKRTDKELLIKGVKKMGITLILMFLGPTLIYMALSNKEKPLYIPLLICGFIACSFAVYFGFKGINTIMNSIFHKNRN